MSMPVMTRNQLHEALRQDINFVDPGIEIRPIKTEWGSIVTLYRQGRATKWRVYFFRDGSSRVEKPQTPTLPPVCLVFSPSELILVRDYLTHFIQIGWI